MKKIQILFCALFCLFLTIGCSDFVLGSVDYYTLTFNWQDGTNNDEEVVKQGESITLPVATRDDYIFNGWYSAVTDGNKYGNGGDNYTITETLTMYARWRDKNAMWDENPITINTEDELREFAKRVNNGNSFSGKTIMLANDITIKNGEWIPIGTTNRRFAGTFDGNWKTISGIYISGYSQEDYQGLFGVSSGTIRNLGVDVNIKGGGWVGGISGLNYNGIISYCWTNGSLIGTGNSVGGLVGENGNGNSAGTITECISNASVEGYDRVGGLVGFNSNGSVARSYATGRVKGRNSVGGLAGMNGCDKYAGTITDCYAKGNVTGNDDVGGLAGGNGYGSIVSKITKCYATGNVTGTTSYVGGLVGYNYTSGTYSSSYYSKVVDCYASGNATKMVVMQYNNSYSITGNTAMKSVSDMKLRGTYSSSWDFTTIWGFDPNKNSGFPYLRALDGSY